MSHGRAGIQNYSLSVEKYKNVFVQTGENNIKIQCEKRTVVSLCSLYSIYNNYKHHLNTKPFHENIFTWRKWYDLFM